MLQSVFVTNLTRRVNLPQEGQFKDEHLALRRKLSMYLKTSFLPLRSAVGVANSITSLFTRVPAPA